MSQRLSRFCNAFFAYLYEVMTYIFPEQGLSHLLVFNSLPPFSSPPYSFLFILSFSNLSTFYFLVLFLPQHAYQYPNFSLSCFFLSIPSPPSLLLVTFLPFSPQHAYQYHNISLFSFFPSTTSPPRVFPSHFPYHSLPSTFTGIKISAYFACRVTPIASHTFTYPYFWCYSLLPAFDSLFIVFSFFTYVLPIASQIHTFCFSYIIPVSLLHQYPIFRFFCFSHNFTFPYIFLVIL